MTEDEFAAAVAEALQADLLGVGDGEQFAVMSTTSFAEAGVLTGNFGLVVKLDDGSEFQVTVVRSR
jgi:hypothetical protein